MVHQYSNDNVVGRTKTKVMELWKDWRMKLYIVILIASIFSLVFIGLDYGMDFRGGTLIQLRLEEHVDAPTMGTMVTILSERLNGFGLKDIAVRPFGTDYISVEMSASDSATVEELKNLISQQGSFEAVIDGEIVLYSEDITGVVTNPQGGYGYMSSTQKWQVPFQLSKEGSDKFAEAAKGKCTPEGCDLIYMFIDRPQNAAIVMPQAFYDDESEMSVDPNRPGSFPLSIEDLEKASFTKVFVSDELTPELLIELAEYDKVIVPEGNYTIPAESDITFIEKPKTTTYWVWGVLNLENVLFLTEGVTSGEPIREAIITGGAQNIEEATKEMTKVATILRSGRLPVGLHIASTSSVSPTLGSTFLSDSVTMGILALLAVAFVVFFRYREPKVTGLMMIANVSEVMIILGITALIRHQLDIASIAGIIASVGTGVDQFIIITDEVKRGEHDEVEESTVARIKKAFKIIMASAATVTAAMLPLMTLGLGLLKGFAITTLIGVFIGVFIVRPAFGKAVEKFL